jgi:transcriptional regulator with XRE-family HTH domain
MNTIEKIKNLVLQSGKSANMLFTSLQMPHNALREWEKGKANPSLDALIKLADYFCVSLDWLCGRTENWLSHLAPPANTQSLIEYLKVNKSKEAL